MRDKLAGFGLLTDSQGAAGELLSGHLDDWRKSLLAKGTKAKQADLQYARAKRIFDNCGFKVWSDIVATDVESFLGDLRDKEGGISQQTFNFYVQAVKQFGKWMVRYGRAMQSPIKHLSKMTVTERVHERRELTLAERTALLQSTAAAVKRYGMDG